MELKKMMVLKIKKRYTHINKQVKKTQDRLKNYQELARAHENIDNNMFDYSNELINNTVFKLLILMEEQTFLKDLIKGAKWDEKTKIKQ